MANSTDKDTKETSETKLSKGKSTDMLTVKDTQLGTERKMSKHAYNQIRLEEYKDKPRYEVTDGKPDALPKKK